MGAFEIVMEDRKKLVEQVIENMKKGYILLPEKWNAEALYPQNPISKVQYRGGNRLRLINQVVQHGYQDPRWMTAKQLKEQGFYVKKGEKQTICEKWIFEKQEKYKDGEGNLVIETVPLEKPIVYYFGVFNGEQVQDFPPFTEGSPKNQEESIKLGLSYLDSSACKVTECAQPKAFYSPGMDRIVLPLKAMFRDEESYIATGFHEMVHSTGHPSRLNRDLNHPFGTPGYAKEELRAELGAMFLKADLGLSFQGDHFQSHSNYLNSWIQVLGKDPHELFRAASDAERAAGWIKNRYLEYQKNPEKEQGKEKEDVKKNTHQRTL